MFRIILKLSIHFHSNLVDEIANLIMKSLTPKNLCISIYIFFDSLSKLRDNFSGFSLIINTKINEKQ